MHFTTHFTSYAEAIGLHVGFYHEPYRNNKIEIGYPSSIPGVRIIEMPVRYFPAGVLGFTNTVDKIWIPYGLEEKKMVIAHEEEHVKDRHASEAVVQHRAREQVGYDNAMIYIETYGCASNQSDSEIMAGLLTRAGFHVISNIEVADMIIVNTCSVKETTSNKTKHRIWELAKKYPMKKLIIAGCMPEAEYKEIKEIAPKASLVATRRITEIAEAVRKVFSSKSIELLGPSQKPKICLPKIRKNPVVDIVEICSGCELSCSYCATKLAKGQLFSYPEENIVAEISLAKDAGCREFWITGQDIAAYGRDTESSLPILVKKIVSEVKGKYFLRLGMMNPENAMKIRKELGEIYKDEHVFKFLHIPLQSGSDSILKKMNRPYTAGDFVRIVEYFRKAVPSITIWTDVIVGFPDETDEDFRKTVDVVNETKPDFVNVSRYSARRGTKAAEMQQLDTETKKERSRIMSTIVDRLSEEQNKKWLDWSGVVLVDEYNKEKQNWIGRNYAYKPVVLKNGALGETVKVRITDAEKTHLVALH